MSKLKVDQISKATGAAPAILTLPAADGAADTFLKTDGSGALSFATAGGSNVPQFSVYMSADMAVAYDTFTVCAFDTADINDDGAGGTCVNITASGTNPRGFTVPTGQAGKYCLSYVLLTNTVSAATIMNSYATFYWAASGGTPANKWTYGYFSEGATITAYGYQHASTILVDLAVGDHVYVYGRIATDGSSTNGRVQGGENKTRFSGFKLL